MNFIEMLIPVFVLLILVEVVINLRNKSDFYSIPDTISDMSLGMISRLTDLFVLIFMYNVYVYLQNNFSFSSLIPKDLFEFSLSSTGNKPFWTILSYVGLFLAVDFLFYWNHRFSHEINFLWASHVAHHSSQEYNLTVALRQSFLRNAIALIFYMVFSLFGIPWMVLLLTDALNRLYQFWVHTRYRIQLPHWFSFLFVTPAHHRVHHARNPRYLDKNYAGVFIFWDRMFGTFAEEDEEPLYGIVKPLKTFQPIRANLHVYREIFQMLASPLSLRLKMKALFSKPDFMSSLSANFHPPTPGREPSPKSKYKSLNARQSIATFFMLIVLIALSLVLIKSAPKLDLSFVFLFYLSLLGGYGLLGNYLDSKTEIGRL